MNAKGRVGAVSVRISVLGPLEVRHRDIVVPVGSRRRPALFTLLVAYAGQIVRTGDLIAALGRDRPPATARTIVQVWISGLRRVLAEAGLGESGLGEAGGCAVLTHPLGYQLVTPAEAIDAYRFERLVEGGRAALAAGEPALARTRL